MSINSQVVITRIGGPEVLELKSSPLPDPRPHEVRIRILATGVSYADVMMRKGTYPFAPKTPFTPGYDVVGTIDRMGSQVTGVSVGQLVVALTEYGGYAKYICVPQQEVVAVPAGVKPEEAVSLVLNYVTAYQMLHRSAEVKSGETVLIHGAGGGVGTALLELGKLAGLRLIGTASRGKHAVVHSFGAEAIDYQADDLVLAIRTLVPQGVDVVFDPFGGPSFKKSYQLLNKTGRLIAFGHHHAINTREVVAGMATIAALKLRVDRRRVKFYSLPMEKKLRRRLFTQDLNELLRLLSKGDIQPIIAAKIPLEQSDQAHRFIENRLATGKVVLICNGYCSADSAD